MTDTRWWTGDGHWINTMAGDAIELPGGLIEQLGSDEFVLTIGPRADMWPVWRLWDVWEAEARE